MRTFDWASHHDSCPAQHALHNVARSLAEAVQCILRVRMALLCVLLCVRVCVCVCVCMCVCIMSSLCVCENVIIVCVIWFENIYIYKISKKNENNSYLWFAGRKYLARRLSIVVLLFLHFVHMTSVSFGCWFFLA